MHSANSAWAQAYQGDWPSARSVSSTKFWFCPNTTFSQGLALPANIESMPATDSNDPIQQARLWRDKGWTAEVIKNNDDEGWAVAMSKDGQAEPALVGPWTMGRDKKNPKPLDVNAFNTLVKTAAEVLRRHEQQRHAQLHKRLSLDGAQGRIDLTLDIVPDDDDPHALLAAHSPQGELLGRARVSAGFKLDTASAAAWIDSGYARPGR